MLLLVLPLMHSNNEKEQSELGKILLYSLKRKTVPRGILELNPMLKEIKSLKKSLILSRIQGVTSGQDHTQLSFQFVIGN